MVPVSFDHFTNKVIVTDNKLTILRSRLRLGWCCVELHYGAVSLSVDVRRSKTTLLKLPFDQKTLT